MPVFNYQGRDNSGNLQQGQLAAANQEEAGSKLVNEGIIPIKLKEQSAVIKVNWLENLKGLFAAKVSMQELTIFSRQMQLLYKANVPIMTALQQLAVNARSKTLRLTLMNIQRDLQRGLTLSQAMQLYANVFSPLMISLVQVGEKTGKMEAAFSNLHDYLQFEIDNSKKFKSSFRYPIFTFVSIMMALISINTLVIPTFSSMYANLGVKLPWETQLLIFFSNLTTTYGYYTLAISVALIGWCWWLLQKEKWKVLLHKYLLKIPIYKGLIQRILLVKFSQSLGIMLQSGFPITQSLAFVKNIIPNFYIKQQLDTMQNNLFQGKPFSQAIDNISLLSPLEKQILSVGEKNGELVPALQYIASYQTHEIEYEIKRVNDFLGPALIAILSGLILIVALGVYLPIWNMINLVRS